MAALDTSPPSGDDEIKGPRWNAVEVEDGREERRFWLPRYLGEYANQIGARGVAIYASLAWWITDDAPHHRPALREIAERAGVSRSTVWRSLKDLEAVGLVEVIGRIDTTGRRPHKLRLTTPPERRRAPPNPGMPVAGGSNLSAPRAQDERAARSDCARGALEMSAPSLDQNKDLKVCVESPDTHTLAPPPSPPESGPHERLQKLWEQFLAPGAPKFRGDQIEEAPWAIGVLLSCGWTEEQLAESIEDPWRDRAEWPRVWAKRLGLRPPQPAQTPPDPKIERQEWAEAERKLAAERETEGFKEVLARLRAKIGRRPDAPAV